MTDFEEDFEVRKKKTLFVHKINSNENASLTVWFARISKILEKKFQNLQDSGERLDGLKLSTEVSNFTELFLKPFPSPLQWDLKT